MKRCPECAMSRPYELSDGRYKCRSCGKKFSWTSVWDSVRLSSRETAPTSRAVWNESFADMVFSDD
ncbi:transposase [Burkholderia pseudomallei]|uniref:transposase n=1 Tax=Burkholderia pseudomallei TaxID=28450 RepID=UPI0009B29FFD|nr:transposase [Burkholderia pseudomallei]